MAKFAFVEWLVSFLESVELFKFEWDEGNSLKNNIKHGIAIEQIEACFYDEEIIPLGIQIEPSVEEERYGIIAKDFEGIILFISFTIREDKIRPVSARVANKKERHRYDT